MSADAGEIPEPELHERFARIWGAPPGLGRLSAVNHTSVGLRYIFTGLAFFLAGGLLAMLMRSQLAWSRNDVLDFDAYNQAFTMHGTTMMFLFAVPIVEGFGVYLVPKMIGARDLPLPRLGAYGYWCYLLGGLLLYSSFLFGVAPDTGWYMYPPLTHSAYSGPGVDFWLLGITFAEISAVSAAVELIVAILKTRAPGMSLQRMPLFVWAVLVTAFMIVFAFPPLIVGSILLEVQRAFGLVFYDAARGGDPLLWQHLFWIFGHPEVYIILLPAFGIVSAIVVTFARRTLVGYEWAVLAVFGIGFISFGLWMHHMFTVGIPFLTLSFFSAASMAVAIPSGILVFTWISTLWQGTPRVSIPLLYVLGLVITFVAGGLTGVMVALVPFDWQVHDTHFVVAHFHYVLIAGVVFPVLAALYYWLPLVAGTLPSQSLGRVAFWLIFIGFNVTFLPMHLTGLLGMPRRVYTYPEGLGWEWPNLISTLGSFITTAGIGALLVDLALHFFYGRRVDRNPWQAGTLEWAIRPGVPPYNFISIPAIDDREPLWARPDLAREIERGEFWLADPRPGRRETFGSTTVHAHPEYVICLSQSTWWPLLAALATAVFFVGVLAKLYGVAILAIALVTAALVAWAWTTGNRHAPDRIDIGAGSSLPMHATSPHGPGWWALAVTLLVDAAAFTALLFAYFFLWATQWSAWPLFPRPGTGWSVPLAATLTLLAGSAAVQWGLRVNARGRAGRFQLACAIAAVLAVAALALQVEALRTALALRPAESAYASTVVMLIAFHLVHVGIAIVMLVYAFARSRCGWISERRPLEARVVGLFWHYTAGTGVAALAVIHLFPLVA